MSDSSKQTKSTKSDSPVLLPKNINVSKIRYSAPKVLANSSRAVYMNYEGAKITFQTPFMFLPYGIGDGTYKGKDGQPVQKEGDKRYELHASFREADKNPALKYLQDKLTEIGKDVVDKAFDNRIAWLNGDYEGIKAVVATLFTPVLKIDKDKNTGKPLGKYPPTLKTKLPYDAKTDTFLFKCDDVDGNQLDFKNIMGQLKGARARLILEIGGIWFAGGKYGITIKVLKATFQLSYKTAVEYVVDPDDATDLQITAEEDQDVAEDASAKMKASNVVVAKPTTIIEDSDEDPDEENEVVKEDDDDGEKSSDEKSEEEEEEDDDDDEEPPPPPPPPPPTPAPPKKGSKTKK